MSYYKTESVREAAKGHWLYILSALAPQLEPALKKCGHHVPCPVHGGKDGFRLFKDVVITGGGICNTCGAKANGFELLKWVNGWDFKKTLEEVGRFLNVEKEPSYRFLSHPHANKKSYSTHETRHNFSKFDPDKRNQWLDELESKMEKQRLYNRHLSENIDKIWHDCLPLSHQLTEPMRLYFQHRGLLPFNINEVEKTDCLKFSPSLSYWNEGKEIGKFPAIVAAIRNRQGEMITLHRTYLTQNGYKADVISPKKMMPIPDTKEIKGASIHLGKPTEGILGFAEGLETALSVYKAIEIPVWSTINATLMTSVDVPENVHTVLIWADKDKSLTGESAANSLKSRLEKKGINVYVLLPKQIIPQNAKGVDWNDVLISQGRWGFPNVHYLRDFITRNNNI